MNKETSQVRTATRLLVTGVTTKNSLNGPGYLVTVITQDGTHERTFFSHKRLSIGDTIEGDIVTRQVLPYKTRETGGQWVVHHSATVLVRGDDTFPSWVDKVIKAFERMHFTVVKPN